MEKDKVIERQIRTIIKRRNRRENIGLFFLYCLVILALIGFSLQIATWKENHQNHQQYEYYKYKYKMENMENTINERDTGIHYGTVMRYSYIAPVYPISLIIQGGGL